MIRSSILSFFLALITISVSAQNNFYNQNNQVLMQDRYDKIDGTPYLLEDWGTAVLYPLKGESLRHAKINYNGTTGTFEIVEGDAYIELNAALYNKVELNYKGKTYTFVNRLKPDDVTYYMVLHEGKDYLFLEHFEADLRSQGANYGVSADQEKFVPVTNNYVWKDGTLHDINRNTKKIVSFFDSPALKKEVKNKKLNLKDDADLSAALSYYDQRQEKKN
ncbi:hypothetical protein [Flavilitoribacter nigricans]|uniref:Uncharacterized protein n=1 Tax=Flavilitoribacter nigricans (strain ATCC 23147 / DSM 23189 / NBRC 102662 / NCIMB 1420 / SS-2) TaxID=1122177 RepID=A0A2D0N5Z4_FLAN2|nr:hypothetical protein [Flavilitoribacter nigricans]PHN03806.1 hypothetical protein CRP01_24980 [Flavilitoribacter nigricans DSM 23189 = NBRC 102662]